MTDDINRFLLGDESETYVWYLSLLLFLFFNTYFNVFVICVCVLGRAPAVTRWRCGPRAELPVMI